jgi:rsbT antagonist protein RsbS
MDGTPTIPIIKLHDDLIVSIQVDLSDRVVLELKEHIAQAIIRTGATGLVLEVSGMELMDSFITKAIGDIAKTAKLMGVETALAGLSPMIAMTLVEMGMEFSGVHNALNLEDALEQLAEARQQRGLAWDEGAPEELAEPVHQPLTPQTPRMGDRASGPERTRSR